MGAYPSAALQGLENSERQPTLIDQQARLVGLQGLLANQQQQQQLRPLQLQQQQAVTQEAQIAARKAAQGEKDTQAVTAAMASDDFDGSDPIKSAHLVIQNGGSGQAAQGLSQMIIANSLKYAEQAKNNAQTFEANTTARLKQQDMLSGHIKAVLGASDTDLPQAILDESKELDPQHAQAAQQMAQQLTAGQLSPSDARMKLKALANSLLADSQQAEDALKNAQAEKAKREALYGTGPQGDYIAAHLQAQNLQPTPQNIAKMQEQYNQETRIQPGVARMEILGNMREYPGSDPNTLQPTYQTPNQIKAAQAAGGTGIMPGSIATGAMNKTALIEDIRGGAEQVRQSINGLSDDEFSMKDRALIAGALKSRDPRSAVTQLIGGQFKGALSDKQQEYLINQANLVENAMAMRSVLGAGQGSEDLRQAIVNTIPGATTPNRKYAIQQLDTFEKTLSRLERGIPNVPLRPNTAGAAPSGGTPKVAKAPNGAVGIAPGSDGKNHYHDAKGNDLGVAP